MPRVRGWVLFNPSFVHRPSFLLHTFTQYRYLARIFPTQRLKHPTEDLAKAPLPPPRRLFQGTLSSFHRLPSLPPPPRFNSLCFEAGRDRKALGIIVVSRETVLRTLLDIPQTALFFFLASPIFSLHLPLGGCKSRNFPFPNTFEAAFPYHLTSPLIKISIYHAPPPPIEPDSFTHT